MLNKNGGGGRRGNFRGLALSPYLPVEYLEAIEMEKQRKEGESSCRFS